MQGSYLTTIGKKRSFPKTENPASAGLTYVLDRPEPAVPNILLNIRDAFDTGSITNWLLAAVCRSTPYSAGDGDYKEQFFER